MNSKSKYYIGVVGGRDFDDYRMMKRILNPHLKELQKRFRVVIVSGGAMGADKLAEKYARKNQLEIIIFPADWSIGPRAGPERNKKIVAQSDELFAFWDGESKGTRSTITISQKQNKSVTIVSYGTQVEESNS